MGGGGKGGAVSVWDDLGLHSGDLLSVAGFECLGLELRAVFTGFTSLCRFVCRTGLNKFVHACLSETRRPCIK